MHYSKKACPITYNMDYHKWLLTKQITILCNPSTTQVDLLDPASGRLQLNLHLEALLI